VERKEHDAVTTDRDQSIERLLRQALPPDAHAPDGVYPDVSSDDCPDAETLAALADDTLTAAARRDVETHIADCHRCQAMTAAMVRAEVAEVASSDATVGAVPAWRRRAFNWLVPAAAAATAAIALWVLIPGQRTPLPDQPQADSQFAAPVSPPPLESEVVTEEPLRIPGESRADSAALERDANVAQEKAAPAAPTVSAPAEGGLPPSRDATANPGQASGASGTPSLAGADQTARQESRSLEERVTVVPPPSRDAAAEQTRASAPTPPAAGQAARQESAPAEAQREGVAGGLPPSRDASANPGQTSGAPAAALGASAALRRAVPGFEVVSSDARIRWSVGPSPVVQYTTDGGATWTAQQTGAPAELTAGSAPTPTVAWLVGRRSVVLRTTDGGRRWERVTFPETLDLSGVIASTALNATVTLADGRRFATIDGGKSWAAVTR
jgi:hypothetical protein